MRSSSVNLNASINPTYIIPIILNILLSFVAYPLQFRPGISGWNVLQVLFRRQNRYIHSVWGRKINWVIIMEVWGHIGNLTYIYFVEALMPSCMYLSVLILFPCLHLTIELTHHSSHPLWCRSSLWSRYHSFLAVYDAPGVQAANGKDLDFCLSQGYTAPQGGRGGSVLICANEQEYIAEVCACNHVAWCMAWSTPTRLTAPQVKKYWKKFEWHTTKE